MVKGRGRMLSELQQTFSLHENMLNIRSKRAEIIASNLVNADTPGYKAKDIDFKRVIDNMSDEGGMLTTTAAQHISDENDMSDGEEMLLYRIPNQASLDGNTVDTQIENAQFTENTMHYIASLRFLDGKIKSTLAAIKGE